MHILTDESHTEGALSEALATKKPVQEIQARRQAEQSAPEHLPKDYRDVVELESQWQAL